MFSNLTCGLWIVFMVSLISLRLLP